ncbi:hypothetical protein L226DRAFT_81385 [Lentinus tigrinus ALCF2SS1-7]|uniref:uncharacterized protein n=1 Tax=Lentinus tigrinus ALCF2SS1-7 TaxID=1328758 RepID=UPI00116622F1|nr:hypothetical protein L226DRAFT_81385 [Lentinus tigrinus ALCF2SS1-7]
MTSESALQDGEAIDGVVQVDEKRDDTEAAPDIEAWNFPSPEVSMKDMHQSLPPRCTPGSVISTRCTCTMSGLELIMRRVRDLHYR